VGVIDREVIGKPFGFGYPQDLGAGEMDHPCHAGGFGGQQDMPGAGHIDRHDLFRATRRIVRERPQMHDRAAAFHRTPDLAEIEKIQAVSAVKAHYVVAEEVQMIGYRDTDVAAMPGDQNAHVNIIPQ
jgi:hypothetical protein